MATLLALDLCNDCAESLDDDVFGSGMEPNSNEVDVSPQKEPPREYVSRMRSRSLIEIGIQDQVSYALANQLKELHTKLKLKEAETNLLNKVPDQLTDELRELDITLEREANALIKEANDQREHAEKMLHEAKYKLDGLQGEVKFLKSLVLTSTPSNPNRHLHPQIQRQKKPMPKLKQPKFVESLRRSISNHSLNKSEKKAEEPPKTKEEPDDNDIAEEGDEDYREVDLVCCQELKSWMWSKPKSVDIGHPFINRIVKEDVNPCLSFKNQQLANEMFYAAIDDDISINPIQEVLEEPIPCHLTEAKRGGVYIVQLGIEDNGPRYTVCKQARNKLAVVCNFFMYLRYIIQGIIQREDHTVYWDIVELRRQMAFAKLDLLS